MLRVVTPFITNKNQRINSKGHQLSANGHIFYSDMQDANERTQEKS